MVSVKIKATIPEKGAYKGRIERTRRRLENRRKPHSDAKVWLVGQWSANFLGQGVIYGAWPPLAPSTVEYRELLAGWGELAAGVTPSSPPLIRSEMLLVKDFVRANKAGEITMDATRWEFSNEEPRYLLSHHFGQSQPRGGFLPPRKLWDISGTDEAYIVGAFKIWVMEVLAQF